MPYSKLETAGRIRREAITIEEVMEALERAREELEAIEKTGLVEPLEEEGWEEYLVAAREIAHEEVRKMLAGLSPFSANIIAERDEGR